MTPPTTTSVFEDEVIFLADALVMLSDKTKLKGVAIKEVKEPDRPARSILTLKPLPTIDPKDKGKGVLKESPVKKVKKSDLDAAQIAKDAEVARLVYEEELAKLEREKEERQRQEQASMDYIANLYDEVKAKIDTDQEVAVRWTHDEQEKYTVDERAKLLAEFFKRRKKQHAKEKVAAIRNKPLIRTQLRSLMMTYLKHTGIFKHNQLNRKTFEEIQALYIKEQERAADFMPIRSEEDERQIQKMNKKATSVHEEKVLEESDSTKINKKDKDTSKKRKEGPRMKRMSKKKKTNSDLKEEEHLKTFLKIVPDAEGEVIYEVLEKRSDGSSRWIKTFSEMVTGFDRLDLVELYNLVIQRFETTTPEGVDLVLWGDLKIMFDANTEEELWQNQERWNLKKRKYPLTKETLEWMMSLKLVTKTVSESAYNLLRFIQKQIDESESHDRTLAIPEQMTTDDKDWKLMITKSQKSLSSSKSKLKNSYMFGYILQVIKKFKLKKHKVSTASVSFSSGSMNYNMHSMGKTVNELHAMLKLHEETLPKKVAAPVLHTIRAGKVQKNKNRKPSKAAKGVQGKGKGKKAYANAELSYAPKPKIPPPPKKDNPAKDTICHYCGEGLRGSKKLNPKALSLYVGNGQREAVEAIGNYHLCLPSRLVIVLNNCHYAPSITRGIVSVLRLYEDGFINHFELNNAISVSKNNVVYFTTIPRDGLYEIEMSSSNTNDSYMYNVSNKRAKLNLDSSLLWHCRLRHISKKHIKKLQHDRLLNSTGIKSLGNCVSCMSGKMARKPYSHQVERAKDLL
ncbi:zinc finger, CCHC-type containing protein [Tanacetum coccineum]